MKVIWILLVMIGVGILGKKIFDKKKDQPNSTVLEDEVLTKPVMPSKSARVAFLENLDKFIPLLPSLCNGSFCSSDWTDNIIDIDNDELTMYWKKAHTSVDAWLRLLASWGLKTDNCTSFKAMEVHKKMYVTKDDAELVLGRSYKVIQKCWIQTNLDNQSKVLILGKVE